MSGANLVCADWFGGMCEGTGFWSGDWVTPDTIVFLVLFIGVLWVGVYAWVNLRYWWGSR